MLFQELQAMIVAISQLGDLISRQRIPANPTRLRHSRFQQLNRHTHGPLDLLHSANSDAFDFIARRDPMNVIF
jgi:hypothetical protein